MDLQSTVVGFGFGMLSTLIALRITEHLRSQQSLSEKVFVPLHEQLSRTRSRVEERLDLDEEPVWKQLQASGLTEKVPRRVRARMARFHEKVVPTYNNAYMSAFQQWTGIAQKWNGQFGVQTPSSYSMCQFNWWTFLMADECDESVIPRALGANEVVNIWSGMLTANRLSELRTSLDQFFRDRWSEVRDDPVFVYFRTVRRETLDEIEQALKHVVQHIKP
jgi:hypothetical protein